MTIREKLFNPSKPEHSIGNGEVDSSILSGSTILPNKIGAFDDPAAAPNVSIAQNEAGNAQEQPGKIRGLCSPAVPDTADAIKAPRALAAKHSGRVGTTSALANSAANCLVIINLNPNDPEAEQVRGILTRALAGIEKNMGGGQ